MKRLTSSDLSVGLVFGLALVAAFAVGAWQGRHDTQLNDPVEEAAARSAFVQSGGTTADTASDGLVAAKASLHARVPSASHPTAPAL